MLFPVSGLVAVTVSNFWLLPQPTRSAISLFGFFRTKELLSVRVNSEKMSASVELAIRK